MDAVDFIDFRLPREPTSVRLARALLRVVLGAWTVRDEDAQNAELILSELVTNAVRVPEVSVDSVVGVRIAYEELDGALRIEVSDDGDGKPMLGSPGPDDTHGRGLLIVETLAQSWGMIPRETGSGKTVWAEVKGLRLTLSLA